MLRKIVVLFILLFFAVAGFLYYAFYSPKHKVSDKVLIEIPAGASVKSVGKILEDNKIINNASIFYYTVRLFDKDYSIQAGKFALYKNSGIFRSMEALRQSPLVEDISITIPEGLTVWETAAIVAKTFENADSAEFVALCEDANFIKKCEIGEKNTLEGYLYPETYRFPEGAKMEDVILRLTATYKQVFSQIPRSARSEKLNDEEIVILASIIEKEAKTADEKPLVSGVFYNRIEKKWPIGADATVRFAVKNFNRPIRKSELNSDSPYNTRKFSGLTPGPICSPGKFSLIAAMNPEDTDYLFFMAKWDGSGEHIFSKTNEQHDKVKNEVKSKNRHLADF